MPTFTVGDIDAPAIQLSYLTASPQKLAEVGAQMAEDLAARSVPERLMLSEALDAGTKQALEKLRPKIKKIIKEEADQFRHDEGIPERATAPSGKPRPDEAELPSLYVPGDVTCEPRLAATRGRTNS